MTQPLKRKKFGDILVEGGLITATQLDQALTFGRERELKLGQALRELGFVNEMAVARTIAKQLGMPFVDFDKIVIDPEVAATLPETVARKYKVIVLGRKPGETLIAFADPLDIFAFDEVRRYVRDKIVPCVGAESKIATAINRLYGRESLPVAAAEEEGSDDSAAVAAINNLILQAARQLASDIHIEPSEEGTRVRFRVDGLLRQAKEFPAELHPSLVSRVKILSQLDIGERRKPQDGRFEIPVGGRSLDIRVSILPVTGGEKVVMRLLDKAKIRIDVQDLGFEKEQAQLFLECIGRPHEIILVTGPTGSGKTTTLYAALNHINSVHRNIVTVEDPVEYELAGVNQVQVNRKADLTFASALRSILRQDPDVIMIGEIRDAETAEIAVQSALTGHLVLSTLHTNDACSAVTRLIDMGIPPFLIASGLGLVVGQRLVRLLCQECRQPYSAPPTLQEELGLEPLSGATFYRAGGCPACDQTGYKGRAAIYELLPITRTLEPLIVNRASSFELFREAQQEGFISMRQAGIRKVLAGLTTVDEILRVTLDARS
ncbi:MAG: ATPase, T2SS/T4P/T4SS family [Desulfobacteraceae bacterium]|nr:ATPase, T2SS/T4P/T4SS family [Desulfobacteraceae bacterium]